MALLETNTCETANNPGTGTVTLLGPPSGRPFKSFATSAYTNGARVYYMITDDQTVFEEGLGTYSTSGPTLTRDTVYRNSSGTTSKINFTSAVYVYSCLPCTRVIYLDATGNVAINGAVSVTSGTTTLSAGGGWSSSNIGKQLLITTPASASNPAIGITDASGTNLWGIYNNAGTLKLASMPAYSNNSTAPTDVISLTSTSVALVKNTSVTGTLTSSGQLITTSGGHTITAGGLTVIAGGASITGASTISGGLTISSVGLSVTGTVVVTGGGSFSNDFSPLGGITNIENNANFYLQNSGGNPTLNFAASVYMTYGSSTLSINAPGAMGISASDLTIVGDVNFSTGLVSFGGSNLAPFGGGILYSGSGTPPYSALAPGSYSVSLAAASNILANQFLAASDADLKKDIEPLSYEEALAWLRMARPKKYSKQGMPEYGYLAQDWIGCGWGHMIGTAPTKGMAARHYPDFPDEWKHIPADTSLTMDRTNGVPAIHVIVDEMLNEMERMRARIKELEGGR